MNTPGPVRRSRKRLTSIAVIGLVVVALAVVVASARETTVRPVASSSGPAPALVGIGDSVAAGYGLGPADGDPDNALAYPYLAANALDLTGHDLAVSGACVTRDRPGMPFARAAGTPHACDATVSAVEQASNAIDRGLNPKVVTVTIGANDIRFVDCFAFILGATDDDECSGSTFDTHLAALQQNLTGLLRYVHGHLPYARLVVTGYYNVFPDAPADGGRPCVLSRLLAAKDRGVPKSTYLLVVHRKAFDKYAATVTQPEYHRRAQVVVDRLDDTIRSAAIGLADFASLDEPFAGHDMCGAYPDSGYAPYVFAPRVQVQAHLGFTVTIESAIPTETCRPPCTDDDSVSRSWGPIVGEFTANGAPHPNAPGEAAMAQATVNILRS